VEVTYPPIAKPTQKQPTQQTPTGTTEITTPNGTSVPETAYNNNPHIIKPATLMETDTENTSTKTQHGNLITTDDDENTTDNTLYHDANKYWNALKIKRQRTVKGTIQYLVKWEDNNYPGTWTTASDVNDELKRVFYLTHTKMGARRKTPIKEPTKTLVINVQDDDEWSDCQSGKELLI